MALITFLLVSVFVSYTIGQSNTAPVEIAWDSDAVYDGEDFIPGYLLKRSFWSPHPSDYNPMRRPGPLPRNIASTMVRNSQESKRTHPYHPLPRNTALRQREAELFQDEFDEDDAAIDGGRAKKQARAAKLVLRVGSRIYPLSSRRQEGKNYVPTGPTRTA